MSLFLAFFLHRIHHLVPPRLSNRNTTSSGVARVLTPAVQIGCRAPGLLLILKSVAGLCIAIALERGRELEWLRGGGGMAGTAGRAAARALSWSTAWAGKGTLGAFLSSGTQAFKLDHPSLLWSTYMSLAASVTCETFTRALSDDLPHVHHFNIMSFSFLMHVHSAPPSASNVLAANNGELYIYLLLTLLELFALQLSYILPYFHSAPPGAPPRGRRGRKPYRLPITAAFSLISQFFAIRSWLRIFGGGGNSGSSTSPDGSGRELELFSTVWLNKLPEICFEITVGTSIGLKVVAGLIRGEELSAGNIVGHPAMAPNREEDYAVALIKYTTHMLTATRLSGLAFELSPLEVLPLSLSTPLTSMGLLDPPPSAAELAQADREAREMGTGVVLRSSGEVWFDEPVPLSAAEVLQHRDAPPSRHSHDHPGDGFGHEIRRITVEDRDNPLPAEEGAIVYPGQRGMAHLEGQRKTVLWRFAAIVFRMGFYCAWRVQRWVRRVARRAAAKIGWRRREYELDEGLRAGRRDRRRDRSRTPPLPSSTSVAAQRWPEEEEEDDGEYIPGGAAEGYSSDEDESADEAGERGWETQEDQDDDDDDELAIRSPPMSPYRSSAPVEDDDVSNPLSLFSDLSRPLPSFASSSRPAAPRTTSTDLVIHNQAGISMTPEELAPYLLAHHLAPSSSAPLTRRRYQALLPSSQPSYPSTPHAREEATSSAIAVRRDALLRRAQREGLENVEGGIEGWMERKREEWRDGRSRFCVVCTVEERTVVLWPCRCLCLCDHCRAALADRTTTTSAGGTLDDGGRTGGICPTCRSDVVGFSRIYIP
ncbi:hypothetical protein JCM10213v2_007421 [Rhodosporidiobolus nylandii]